MRKIFIIAEIGINHNGDMNLAKELILKARDSGADAVKFQKRTISEVYSEEEFDMPRQSPWGTTNRQQKEGLEFSIEQYIELEEFTKKMGLKFIISCWDINSLLEVEKHLNVDFHKVASAMITDKKFLEALNNTGKDIIVSVGMCTELEILKSLSILKNVKYVLSCTSTYPTPANEVNLNRIMTLKQMLENQYKIGFSNHHSGMLSCVGAAALGSECIEFHITMDRTIYGSDQSASIENSEGLISEIRKIEILLGDGKLFVYDSERPVLKKLRKINTI